MAKRGPIRRRAVLQYPAHWFEPEDLLAFIELRPFTRWWERLKLSDVDLQALQVLIMTRPKAGTAPDPHDPDLARSCGHPSFLRQH